MATAVLLAAATASAQEWRYRVRPGDTVWDLAGKHLRNDIPWQRLQKHNAIADPYRLVPGSQMRIPLAWLRRQPAKAMVLALQGQVSARIGRAGKPFDLTAGMKLPVGTTLHTDKGENLTLQFADGSRLQLHEDGDLSLDRMSTYGGSGMADTRLRLPRGRTTNTVKRARNGVSRFIVETPNTMSSVRGTVFRIGTDGARSRTEVLQGRVQVDGGGHGVLVAAGRGTTSDARNLPSAPQALPEAPQDVRIDAAGAPVRASWHPVAGATGYRVEVSRMPDFTTLAQDRVVPTAQADLEGLEGGDWHLRVRAIADAGLEGRDSVAAFVASAQPPPFAVEPLHGASVAATHPRLRWTHVQGDGVRYRVQLADQATFAAPLAERDDLGGTDWRIDRALPPGDYYWRVAARDASGRQGPYGGTMRMTLVDALPGPAVEPAMQAADDGRDALHVRWQDAGPDRRYRFQLSRKPDFSVLAVDRELDRNQIALPEARAGTWYMRTQVIESDGYANPYGPTQRVKLGCMPCRIGIGAGVVLLLLGL